MEQTIRDMVDDGTDISCLGGYRRRYQNYGYEKAGQKYIYELSRRNLSQNGYEEATAVIRFEPIGAGDAKHIQRARDLHDSRPFAVNRGDNGGFFLTLLDWNMTPWAAIDAEGRMVGYLTASKDAQTLTEYIADTPEQLIAMLGAWMLRGNLGNLSLSIPPWETAVCRVLGQICESFNIEYAYAYKIINWDLSVRALLSLRASLSPIPDGEFVLGIRDWGNLALKAESGRTFCERTTRPAALETSALDATRLLFGPLPPSAVAELPVKLAPLLAAWLPLPLSWHRQDCV